jgi:hypothetical protein
MPNQKTHRKRLNRSVRGLENVMWAVIATVLVTVVAFVLWSVFTGAASTATAPSVQLVPQESFIIGTSANVTLKFGSGLRGVTVTLMAPTTTGAMQHLASCTPSNINVAEGEKRSFRCDNLAATPSIIFIRVTWTGGNQLIKWVVA